MNTSSLIPSWIALTILGIILFRRLFPRLNQLLMVLLAALVGGLLAAAPVIYFVLFTHLKG